MKPWYTLKTAPAASAANAAAGAAAEPETRAELFIYADIGESWFDETVAARTLVQELDAVTAQNIDVRINSYGGSVSDGIAIHNALRRHPAKITTHVDGIAASIASLIAMAGDVRTAAPNARLMVHAPWAATAGNATRMREVADMLDGWAESMLTDYARATGRPAEEIKGWLNDGADHFFSATQALQEGLITAVQEPGAAAQAHAAAAAPQAAAARSAMPWARPAQANPQQVTPAAAAAQTLESTMTNPNAAAAPEVQAAMNQAAITQAATTAANAALVAETTRQAEIRASAKALAERLEGVEALAELALRDPNTTLQAFRAQALDLKAKGIEPAAGGYIVVTHDEADKQKDAQAAALEIRAGLAKNDSTNSWRGKSLLQMAENALLRGGVRAAMIPGDKLTLIAQAFTHGTSDFPLLLQNIASKSMLKGYEEQPETFQLWTSKGTLPDFKTANFTDIGSAAALREVKPGAEYKYITFGERGESARLLTYGEMFGINRQAIINDDLNAFSAIPRKLGRAARRTVGDLAYAQLIANAAMADGVALFHASHANLQSAAGISTTSVDQMRTAMALQKDIGQTSGALNIDLAMLLVPKALDGAASVVRDSEFEVGAANKNNTVPNSQRNRFQVISDARLDAASGSIWYGAADPSIADTVTMLYLDGNEAPFLDMQDGWTRDGAEWKVRIDVAAKAMDHRGLQRNG